MTDKESFKVEKERNFLHFSLFFIFFFLKTGILAVLQTDVACHLFAEQGGSL